MINRCRERNGVSFDPWDDLNQYVSNVILVLVCGQRFQPGHKTLEICQKISDAFDVLLLQKNQFLIDNVPLSVTLIPQIRNACQSMKDGYHYFTETVDKIIQESKDTTPNCLYTLLLQEHAEGLISTENIKGVLVDSVLAGVITTKPTMYNALAAMVNFPEVQKKIEEEIQRVVGKDRLPGFEDRNKMPYSKAVELEIYRYYTPVGAAGHYPRLQLYRFLDDNGDLLPPENEKRQRLLTFGVGKRSCIGEKLARVRIFLGLTSILHKCDLARDPSESFPSSDPNTYETKFILQPPPYKLQFNPRH
ncbi:cytochrome P450 2C28-like [Haliotis rubra]|uniref:cytochrome P450 2C28-like n=1 Tax=Haliotis rubra TaxID=36100 RepID=UPI001EE5D8D6|nr:cytochrome P450 2C28-like [Haliotis rubra]